jgi:periplasmic protein TonB
MNAGILPVSGNVSQSTARLLVCLVVSVAAHLMAILSFSPSATRYVPPLPFEVELRPAAPQPESELTVPAPSDLTGVPAPVATLPPQPQEVLTPAPPAQETALDLKLPLDKYYTARELDVRAQQINDVHLLYPKRAYEMRLRGKVRLRIFINEQGAIDMISVLEAAPPGVFEEAALDATRALQFSPAVKNGRNVKSQKTIDVVFDPYERVNVP